MKLFAGRVVSLLVFVSFAATAQDWAWMGGSTAYYVDPSYGTMGVPSPSNTPGSREYASSWKRAGNTLWMFGGGVYPKNDLWKYDIASGSWTWVKGSTAINAPATYGTIGVPAAENTPGGRQSSATWVDASGNLWLFGGLGYDGYHNDLWKYDIATGNWTWMKGSNLPDQPSTNGTLGVEAGSNTPGARRRSASWTDPSGNLWLFGGQTADNFSWCDVWKYDIASGNWTWMKGPSTTGVYASYGSIGVPAPTNSPGSRKMMIWWGDANGNLWLFGGGRWTYASPNDLWKYDIATGNWTWVMGSPSNWQGGNYGTMGIAAASNIPCSRVLAQTWTDASGNLWMFGGYDMVVFSGTPMNDLWKFDVSTGYWTWVRGSTYTTTPSQVYGTLGVPDPANTPSGRVNACGWADDAGNVWLYGGYDGYSAKADMWRFGLGGSPAEIVAQPASLTLCPGAPATFSVSATGTGLTYQWRKNTIPITGAMDEQYLIPSVTASDAASYDVVVSGSIGAPAASFAATLTVDTPPSITSPPVAATKCVGQSAAFSVTAEGTGLSYQWRKDGSPIEGATAASHEIVAVITGDAGAYDVIVSGTCSPPVTSVPANLTVNLPPSITSPPSSTARCLGASVVFSVAASGTGLGYQWRHNGSNIGGATNVNYEIAEVALGDAGEYDVVVSGTCAPPVTSEAGTLIVMSPTAITADPTGGTKCTGEPVVFSVTATGSDLTYQWRKNGEAIGGATGATHTIAAIAAGDEGAYDVVVTGACGAAMISAAATLTVYAAPVVEIQPSSGEIALVGNSVVFTSSAVGYPSPTVQWWRSTDNGSAWELIPGETATTITITAVTLAMNGYLYKAVFSNSCGTMDSHPGTLQVKLVVTDIGPVEISLGSNETPAGGSRKMDVLVQFFKNGTTAACKILEGELLRQPVIGNAQNTIAKNYKIPLPHLENVEFLANDYLYCMVWGRRNGGDYDFPIAMWFNGSPDAQSNVGNKPWSRIYKVTIGGNTLSYYYFREGLAEGFRPLYSECGTAPANTGITATTSYQLLGIWRIIGSNMKATADALPTGLSLQQNYPNPCNPSTTIVFTLPEASHVRLAVYDLHGRLVTVLLDENRTAGPHTADFNVAALASGMYVYRIEAGGTVLARTMNVLK